MSLRTPGPWSVISLADGYQFIANDETKVTVCLAPEEPLTNGVLAWPDNSRLIAAAPELLQQCIQLRAKLRTCLLDTPYSLLLPERKSVITRALNEVSEVIAKAGAA